MKIAILCFRSRDPDPAVEDLNLVQAAQELGHEALLIPAWECSIEYREGEQVYWKGVVFPQVDCLIPRARFVEHSETQLHLLRLLEKRFPSLNKADGIAAAKNKIKTMEILSRAGLPIPRSFAIEDMSVFATVVEQLGGYPVVWKAAYGTFGMDVHLVDSHKKAEEIFNDYFKAQKAMNFLTQEFIEESAGRDLRVFVLDGEVLASMERQAQAGEFRSNVELGATARVVEVEASVKNLAIQAVEALGLDTGGVDIIYSKRGPLILEVNANAGFKALEEVSGVKVAEALIQAAVRRSR